MAGNRAIPPTRTIRFGPFELDVRTAELRKHGIRIRLNEQPFRILLMLLEHPGHVVLREEIRLALWPNNTVVEFDHSINAAVQRLRDALGDSADKPRYVETVARRGYRFVGEVEREDEPAPQAAKAAPPEEPVDPGVSDDFSGRVLAHYRILEKLGEGGMGAVYRATDSKLGRDVAVKFLLCPEFAQDPQWLARFDREARVLASLNHPNIAAIFAVEDRALVMELVVGQVLKGPLPLKTALLCAGQIARALEAAHERGVVHRDLKPANIMVKPDGTIKVLDFGLGKSTEGPSDTRNPPTLTSPTRAGMILGTAAYMSPEQAAGKPVDKRTDIWSFGVVLWEMLTGQPLFQGETVTQILAAVLRGPIELDRLPGGTPPAVRELLRRCLDREPKNRLRDVGEARIALEKPDIADPAAAQPAAGAIQTRRLVPAAASVLVVLVALLAFGYLSRPAKFDLSTYRFTPLATEAEPEDLAAWSPDGKSIAYLKDVAGRRQVMVRELGASSPRQLTSVPDGVYSSAPFFSPDGEELYFIGGNSLAAGQRATAQSLWAVSVVGGDPRKVIAVDRGQILAAALSPDGKTLAMWEFEGGKGYRSLFFSSPPGAPQRRYQPVPFRGEGAYTPNDLRFSPDGSRLVLASGTIGLGEIWNIPWPDGPNSRPLRLFAGALSGSKVDFAWMPDSRYLCMSNQGSLYLADVRRADLQQITASAIGTAEHPAVSADGKRIAFTATMQDYDIVELPLDGSPPRPLLATGRMEKAPSWSAAGDRIAFITDRSGEPEIWLRSSNGQWERPIVRQSDFPDAPHDFYSVGLSPDGTRVAYLRGERLWVSPASGGKPSEAVPGGNQEFGGPAWSPDSSSLAYLVTAGGRYQLAVARVGSHQPLSLVPSDVSDQCRSSPAWSPDGQWIACGGAGNTVRLVSPDGAQKRDLPSPVTPLYDRFVLVWSRDAATIYVASSRTQRSRLDAIDVRTGTVRKIAEYGADVMFSNSNAYTLAGSLSGDGKSFATTVFHRKADLWMLEGFPQVQHRWF